MGINFMALVPPELASWADLLAKIGQFLLGVCTLILAIFAATVKRRDFFRSELDKKRLEELGRVRTSLQSLFFDLYYIPSISDSMTTMGWNLPALKANDPDSWEQYQRYKENALELFYKFSDAEYYLFPDWISPEKRKSFALSMQIFAPFTLMSTSTKTQEQRNKFAVDIAEMKMHFDEALRAHA
jgi:hypothetical protein